MAPGKMVIAVSVLGAVIGLAGAERESQPPPASGAEPAPAVIEVPRKAAATVDGVLAPEEWKGAFTMPSRDGGELMLMQDGDDLFVGIRSRSLGYGSLCFERSDEVRVLHSSAALGTAVYQKKDGHWERTRQFDWCCRARQASAEREENLRKEGWLASIGYMGPPEEMEYQIRMDGGEITLAVVYQMGSERETALWWPESLADDCLGLTLLGGAPPETLRFSPETWIRVTPSGEKAPGHSTGPGDVP